LFVTGKTFLPTMDEGAVLVQIAKLPSISLEHSIEGDLRVQKLLLAKVPEVTDIIARVGSDELGLDPMSLNETDSFMRLKPREEWRVQDKDWLVEQIRKDIGGYSRHRAQLYPAYRNARLRNADRRARRSGDQAVRARP
jgi:Cu/Ag efflux pump CusA